jgi:hypothetical protein
MLGIWNTLLDGSADATWVSSVFVTQVAACILLSSHTCVPFLGQTVPKVTLGFIYPSPFVVPASSCSQHQRLQVFLP